MRIQKKLAHTQLSPSLVCIERGREARGVPLLQPQGITKRSTNN